MATRLLEGYSFLTLNCLLFSALSLVFSRSVCERILMVLCSSSTHEMKRKHKSRHQDIELYYTRIIHACYLCMRHIFYRSRSLPNTNILKECYYFSLTHSRDTIYTGVYINQVSFKHIFFK